MNEHDRDARTEPSGTALDERVFLGSCRPVSVRPGGGFPLITQRSLVQIQPPQPTKTRAYGTRRKPFVLRWVCSPQGTRGQSRRFCGACSRRTGFSSRNGGRSWSGPLGSGLFARHGCMWIALGCAGRSVRRRNAAIHGRTRRARALSGALIGHGSCDHDARVERELTQARAGGSFRRKRRDDPGVVDDAVDEEGRGVKMFDDWLNGGFMVSTVVQAKQAFHVRAVRALRVLHGRA
jgi:hypothetical protein